MGLSVCRRTDASSGTPGSLNRTPAPTAPAPRCPASAPVASYMTMSAMTRHMANSGLLVPSCSPTAAVSPTTKAVCEEGMPPDPTTRVQSHTRSV